LFLDVTFNFLQILGLVMILASAVIIASTKADYRPQPLPAS